MKMENDLGRDDIRLLVMRIALPSMLAQFVSVLYSVVDRMYIGNIPKIGETALAGVGVCGPIVTLITAFGSLVGIGGAPLMSIRLGEKDEKGASQILANCFLLLSVISVVITVLALAMKNKLLVWFGASPSIFPYADDYITIYLLGTIFALLSIGMNQFIICQGFAKVAMKSVVLGAVVNIVLDPVFIFACGMGVKGGAFATVLSQMASAGYVLLFLFGKKVPVPITFGGYQWRIMKRVILLGLSPFLIIAFDNVLIIAMNASLQHFGGSEGDMLLTCNTIVQSFMLMVTMPLGGITGGTQTILGYNFGARRSDRVLAAQQYIVILAMAFTAVMFVIAQTVPQYFVQIFTREPEYVELTVRAIKIFTLGIIPLAVQYEIVDGYTGMGIAPIAISLSTVRKTLYLLGVVLIPMFFSVEAVFYTEPISDFLGTAVSIVVYLTTMKKILRRRENGEL
ncbi:MAG: MATE family efflux transporter [Clostridium sp.]|nr:MATE family efflux transporter [Clostridium sp.]